MLKILSNGYQNREVLDPDPLSKFVLVNRCTEVRNKYTLPWVHSICYSCESTCYSIRVVCWNSLSYYSHDPCVILNTSQLSTHATFISWKLFPDYRVQSKDQILKVAQVKLQDSRLFFFYYYRTDRRGRQIAFFFRTDRRGQQIAYHTSDRGEVSETFSPIFI